MKYLTHQGQGTSTAKVGYLLKIGFGGLRMTVLPLSSLRAQVHPTGIEPPSQAFIPVHIPEVQKGCLVFIPKGIFIADFSADFEGKRPTPQSIGSFYIDHVRVSLAVGHMSDKNLCLTLFTHATDRCWHIQPVPIQGLVRDRNLWTIDSFFNIKMPLASDIESPTIPVVNDEHGYLQRNFPDSCSGVVAQNRCENRENRQSSALPIFHCFDLNDCRISGRASAFGSFTCLPSLPDDCSEGEQDRPSGYPFRPRYEFVPTLWRVGCVFLIVAGGLIVGYGRGRRIRLVCVPLALACSQLATWLVLCGHRSRSQRRARKGILSVARKLLVRKPPTESLLNTET